jgi:hypothetical protein
MYKHTLITKYPHWTETSSSIAITATDDNPFSLFNLKKELEKIQADVDMVIKQSLNNGGDGKTFLSNWYFGMNTTKLDILRSKGINLTVTYKNNDDVTVQPVTVDDFKLMREHDLCDNIPMQQYTCTDVTIDSAFVKQVDKLEAKAHAAWSRSDAEDYCCTLAAKAEALCKTDLEREYVHSRSWC